LKKKVTLNFQAVSPFLDRGGLFLGGVIWDSRVGVPGDTRRELLAKGRYEPNKAGAVTGAAPGRY